MATLTAIPVGGGFFLTCRVTSKSVAAGIGVDLYTSGTTPQGTLQIAPDQSITGAWASPLDQIDVHPLRTRPFAPGDVVVNAVTGEALVVRNVRATAPGWEWSNTIDWRTVYPTSGWTVAGSATLT